MFGLLIAFLAAAVIAPLLVARLGPRAFYVLALIPAATVVWALPKTGVVERGGALEQGTDWLPEIGVRLAFRLDALALVMVLIVAGVGTLVIAYCARYFSPGEPGLGRFAATLTAFAGAMLGLVLADDLVILYVFWELTTIGSFLLVGHATDQDGARRAALDALVVTTLGGLAMLVGFLMIGTAGGTLQISELVADPPSGTLVEIGLLLAVLGAVTKSALVPFHFWLPAAMAAPTPVSAYLHAAAMVKAGPYLIARLVPGFGDIPAWRTVIVVLGVITLIAGAWRALRQFDLKLLLAHGTVSQLGLLMILFGTATETAALAGAALLLAHALYKATLFLVVGAVDRVAGTRDIRQLGGPGRRDRPLAVVTLLGVASMAGVPVLLGFVAKETAFAALAGGDTGETVLLAAVVLGSILTVAYALRFAWGVIAGPPSQTPRAPARRCGVLLACPAILAAGGLASGVFAAGLDPLLSAYSTLVPPGTGDAPFRLAAWHGVGVPLLLSAVALCGGAVLFALSGRLAPVQQRMARWPGARDGYVAVIAGLERLALRSTVATHAGSLPVYLATICVVLVLGVGAALVLGSPFDISVRAWDSPAQAVVVALLVTTCGMTLLARRRLAAVAVVGATGYAMAVLFALAGAPDLALTQLLAETLTLVVLVLVLRRLPARFTGRSLSPIRRRMNVAIGLAVGVIMALVTVVATGAREAAPVSLGFAEAAIAAGGNNLVNMTLVEFRAWDTMGELSVLVVAATGVTSLIFLGRRRGRLPRRAEPRDGSGRGWLRAEDTVSPRERSLMLEVAARIVFHTILVVAVYLLLVGHNLPGGGFAAGIVAGLALVVRYLAGGRYELAETLPIGAGALIGLGLVVATGYALAGATIGGAVLQSHLWKYTLPILGEVKVSASLAFDIAVFLVVVGVVLDVLRSFGAEIDRREAAA